MELASGGLAGWDVDDAVEGSGEHAVGRRVVANTLGGRDYESRSRIIPEESISAQ